jgi:hypothetical protein
MSSPSSPASSDKTINQKEYTEEEELYLKRRSLLEFWAMIRQKPMKKSEEEREIIRHNFILVDLNVHEELQFYELLERNPELKSENLGKIYFKEFPKFPREVTEWLEDCAENRGIKNDEIEQQLREIEARWQSMEDGQNTKTEDSK